MKILFLSHAYNKSFISFLKTKGTVVWISEKLDKHTIINFDWVVSYGYKHILSKEILENSKNQIINLHISFLPYNRGADPNYWSFKENTPKGVSIHFIDKGIDTGPLLIQKECTFDKYHTLKSSYYLLKETIENLFFDNFDNIINGKIIPKPQKGAGSMHYKKDLLKPLNYNINIKEI